MSNPFYEKHQSLKLQVEIKMTSSKSSGFQWPWENWGKQEESNIRTCRYLTLVTGHTLNSHFAVMKTVKQRAPLEEVYTEPECDIILVFCPVIRGAAIDIRAALEKLNHISDTKPAVLVVLYHTFDPDYVTTDSSRSVNRDNTITVDCLFYEDVGLLKCPTNYGSLDRMINYIKHQTDRKHCVGEKMETDEQLGEKQGEKLAMLRYFTLLTGSTLNIHESVKAHLKHEIPELEEVYNVDKCDFILTFCPIVSRAGTDIDVALQKLNSLSAIKLAVLVVLHHTFDPERVVPHSSRAVHRKNTITVDCLFHEHLRLLRCKKNKDSLARIINYIKPQIPQVPQIHPILPPKDKMETEQTSKNTVKYFIYCMGNEPNSYTSSPNLHKQTSVLQEVTAVNECDFILTSWPVGSQDRTDFGEALKKLKSISGNKPVVLGDCPGRVLDYVVSVISSSANRQGTFFKDQEPVQSSENSQHHRGQCKNMMEQEAVGPSQNSDKQENVLKVAEPSHNTPKTMEMEMEIKRLRAELSERNSQLKNNESLSNERERALREEEKKKELGTVTNLLSEGIEEIERTKYNLDLLGKAMLDKKRQIQEMI